MALEKFEEIPMQLPISGQCLCKAVQYKINKQPKRNGLCFCRSCQIKTGSSHIAYLAVESHAVEISGLVKWFESIGESGNAKHHGFCGQCGTNLFGKPTLWPDIIVVYAGSLNNPSDYQPEVIVWTQEKPSWACINKELTTFDQNPG